MYARDCGVTHEQMQRHAAAEAELTAATPLAIPTYCPFCGTAY